MYKLNQQNKGFTLIEVMVVVVILGILVAIAIINLTNAQHRARVANVKSNMHSFETLLVVYSSDWESVFPPDVNALLSEGQSKGYFKEFDNPYQGSSGLGISYTDEGGTKVAGVVTYDPITPLHSQYYIYAYDQYKNRIQQLGKDFVLTNS